MCSRGVYERDSSGVYERGVVEGFMRELYEWGVY